MITPFKDRTVTSGMIVKAYRNLHKGGFSLKCIKTNRVVGHSDNFILNDVSFEVNQTGRERVIRERAKNVHAYIIGRISVKFDALSGSEVYYNPYKFDSFVNRDTLTPLDEVKQVIFKENKCFIVK